MRPALLQPAAHFRLVVPVLIAEPGCQVLFLVPDHAMAHCRPYQRREEDGPPCRQPQAKSREDKPVAQIDRVAAEAVGPGHAKPRRSRVRVECRALPDEAQQGP